jgi:hypothetical protein
MLCDSKCHGSTGDTQPNTTLLRTGCGGDVTKGDGNDDLRGDLSCWEGQCIY